MFMARVWTAAHPFEPGYSRAHHRPYRYRMAAPRTPAFRGRARERQVLDRLLDRVRGGESAGLVIRGVGGGGRAARVGFWRRPRAGWRVVSVVRAVCAE